MSSGFARLDTLEVDLQSSSVLPTGSQEKFIVMPHPGDGPQVFLSGIVCLFGSWVGSNKRDT